MLNCDQVFDVLTRGPFPTGAPSDVAVEEHLADCLDCARLAAALRPAVELFQEAIGPDEGRDLPSYWGEVSVELSRQSIVTDEPVPSRQHHLPLSNYAEVAGSVARLDVWWLTAAVLFGVLLGSIFHSVSSLGASGSARQLMGKSWAVGMPSSGRHSGGGISSRGLVAGGSSNFQHPQSIQLPKACSLIPPSGEEGPLGHNKWVETRLDSAYCCTNCHHAQTAALVPPEATSKLSLTCRYCHKD